MTRKKGMPHSNWVKLDKNGLLPKEEDAETINQMNLTQSDTTRVTFHNDTVL